MTATVGVLASSRAPLREMYDAVLVDLDGVVQLGDRPVTGAAAALAEARRHGLRIAFVTNNAARTAAEVVDRLRRLDVDADPAEVVTSSMAAADQLATEFPSGSPVLVVGGTGLWTAVSDAGLVPLATVDDAVPPVAVVQGWGPDVTWHDLAEATVALRAGARWVATNRDRTLPSPRGPLPGSGALIAAVETAIGRSPDVVVGKPSRALFDAARTRAGGESPLMVGDRLDTDIAGARAADLPSLLVLTGVSSAADLLAAPADQRPTYVGRDLTALGLAQPAVQVEDDAATCRKARVSATGEVSGDLASADGLDGLRAAAALAWTGSLPVEQYDTVLHRLGLD